MVDGVEQSTAKEASGDTIPAGQTKMFFLNLFDGKHVAHCTDGDLVARTEQGQEVARIPAPVCAPVVLDLADWTTNKP
jgi:hypothetical protein